MKQTYEVEILGQRFSIKSTEDKAHVDRVVEYINEQTQKIARGRKTLSLNDVSILALLNVADELFRTRAEVGTYKERVVQKAKNILRIIDAQA